jgi:hypothetical protein
MEKEKEVSRILLKIVLGEPLSDEEQQGLEQWVMSSAHNQSVYKEITDPGSLEKKLGALKGYDRELLWKRIRKAIHGHSAKVVWI